MLTAVIAALVCVIGAGFWIPHVVSLYGVRYFSWPAPQLAPWAHRACAIAFCLAATALASSTLPPAAWSGVALIVTALWGVVAADRRFQVIPDRFQLAGTAGAVLYAGATRSAPLLYAHVIVGIGVALVLWGMTALYERVRKKEALGFGDIKLLAWLGIAFGPDTLLILCYALLAALVMAVPALLRKRRTLDSAFAFGPFIAAGVLLRVAELAVQ